MSKPRGSGSGPVAPPPAPRLAAARPAPLGLGSELNLPLREQLLTTQTESLPESRLDSRLETLALLCYCFDT